MYGPESNFLTEEESKNMNRWKMVAPAFLTHMCIGSPWAWSVVSSTLAMVTPHAALTKRETDLSTNKEKTLRMMTTKEEGYSRRKSN